MHQRKSEEFFRQEQVGKQINAGVLFLIKKVKLSIYMFLALGAKNTKKRP